MSISTRGGTLNTTNARKQHESPRSRFVRPFHVIVDGRPAHRRFVMQKAMSDARVISQERPAAHVTVVDEHNRTVLHYLGGKRLRPTIGEIGSPGSFPEPTQERAAIWRGFNRAGARSTNPGISVTTAVRAPRVHGVVTSTPCSAKCRHARGRTCRCSCGGANHGRGGSPARRVQRFWL
jgi:hypothetical protein